ncbi:hypothetical protein ANTQUA_LOCUS5561 [Anthophora quadrimaculata]
MLWKLWFPMRIHGLISKEKQYLIVKGRASFELFLRDLGKLILLYLKEYVQRNTFSGSLIIIQHGAEKIMTFILY